MSLRTLIFLFFLFALCTAYISAQEKSGGLSVYPAEIQLPTGAGSKNVKAVEAYKEGRRAEMRIDHIAALAAYDKAIKLDRKFTGAYLQKGVVLMNDGRGAEAVAAFSEALKIDPKYYQARFNRGFAYWLSTKEYSKAIEDLTRCIDENPKNDFLYTSRAKVYDLIDKPDLAASDREKARALRNSPNQ